LQLIDIMNRIKVDAVDRDGPSGPGRDASEKPSVIENS
jgi:hypothetical protein